MYRQKVSINTFYLYELKQKNVHNIGGSRPRNKRKGGGVGVALKFFLTLSHFFWHVRHCGDRLWSKILRGPSPGSTTA